MKTLTIKYENGLMWCHCNGSKWTLDWHAKGDFFAAMSEARQIGATTLKFEK